MSSSAEKGYNTRQHHAETSISIYKVDWNWLFQYVYTYNTTAVVVVDAVHLHYLVLFTISRSKIERKKQVVDAGSNGEVGAGDM